MLCVLVLEEGRACSSSAFFCFRVCTEFLTPAPFKPAHCPIEIGSLSLLKHLQLPSWVFSVARSRPKVFFVAIARHAISQRKARRLARERGAIMNRAQLEGILVAISLGSFVAYVSSSESVVACQNFLLLSAAVGQAHTHTTSIICIS